MKRNIFVIAIFVFMLCSGTVLAAEEPKPGPQPVLREAGGFWFAYIDFQGPYSNFSEKLNVVVKECRKQNLKHTGPLLGIFYNDPLLDKPEDYRWAPGYPISEDTLVKPPLKKQKFEKTKAVVIMHNYDIKRIVESNQKARKYAKKIGYNEVWPVYEIFHQSAEKPNLVVEIIYPVKKK